jgi:UDP-glucose 4-epimerase
MRHNVCRLVFSSSAAVYGAPEKTPITEDAPLATVNPYGRTKLIIENMINDLVVAEGVLAAISLRYFNPVGAHKSALIGESPTGLPKNLFPSIGQTAAGIQRRLRVFGNDYPTADGTGIRDYIHVSDLARGHLAALDYLSANEQACGTSIPVNLGCGRGYSVFETIAAFSSASGHEIPFLIENRRPGDASVSIADPTRAAELLGWRAKHGIEEMCADYWAFQRRELDL